MINFKVSLETYFEKFLKPETPYENNNYSLFVLQLMVPVGMQLQTR